MALYRRLLGYVTVASESGSGERVQGREHGHGTAAAKLRERNALPLDASTKSISTASFPGTRPRSRLSDPKPQADRRSITATRFQTATEAWLRPSTPCHGLGGFSSRWNDAAAGIVNRPGGASIWHSGLRRRRVGKACCVA